MTITSAGYDGTVDESQFAQLARHIGTQYAVDGNDDWRVEVVAGLDRTVRILPGTGYGHGVVDTSDAEETEQLPVVSGDAGTHRWDLIVARRDWQPPGGSTTFQQIQGTTSRALPAGRLKGPGVVDDQPLALVRVTSGQQLPTAVVDLRCWASKVVGAKDLLGLGDPTIGAEGRVGRVVYRGLANATTGDPEWVSDPYVVSGSATVTLNAANDFTITLPEAFPTQLDSWVAMNGDFSQTNAGQVFIEARPPGSGTANSTRQYLRGKAVRRNGTLLPVNTVLRVNYFASGR